ncbi:TRAP-type C4-dicarboxylate transport system, small permease component [Desulfosporosinus orientis DSM 765]|uniref:TRAP-type C4-dicarboxylate transport system, small permease component n=2 Tax=Desulfosporosinus orientis TaxID=1563 RepID=G7WIZ0_DESOD|nr:TRAP-type C4-dicarboxylate transport system, small permease component [Desulfosporosinus orientis DSM 765]
MPAWVPQRGIGWDMKKIFANLEEYLCTMLLSIMTIVVFYQVFCRFVIKAALPWSEELSIYILAWVTFLGASIGVKRGSHIGVEAVIVLFPKKIQRYFVLLSYIFCTVFFVIIVYYGLLIVQKQIITGQVSPAMRIPMYYAYLSVPVGSILIVIRFVQKFIAELKTKDKSEPSDLNTLGGHNK